MGRRAVAPLLVLFLIFTLVGDASAHANLERSTPAANSVVVDQPKQLLLFFSEQPEIKLTEVELLTAAGVTVVAPTVRPALSDPNGIVAPLPDLAPGTYVVSWHTTSAIDGHTTVGSFPFTYGVGQVPQAVSVPGLSAAEPYAPSALAVIARFLTFTGAIGLAGGLAFGPMVLAQAVATLPERRRRRGAATLDLPSAGERALTLMLWYAVPALLLGTALAALAQAAESAQVAPLAAIGTPLERVLIGTRYGTLFAARFVLTFVAALLAMSGFGNTNARVRDGARLAALVATAGVLATLSLGAHAAAAPQFTPVVVGLDWLHVAAASLWIGGLVQLCLVTALLGRDERIEPIAALISQFSFMSIMVATIFVTGLIQTLVEVGTIGALTGTPYGQALMVKIALFLATGAIGLWHWRWIGPRLSAAAGAGGSRVAGGVEALRQRFRWSALAEAALGVLVLAATGVMTAEQPAKDAAVALRHLSASTKADDLTFDVTLWPGEPGVNRIELKVSPPPQNVQKVVVRLRHLGMDMGEQEIELQPAGTAGSFAGQGAIYAAQDGSLSMSGQWQIEPIVRRTGKDDARAPVTFSLPEPLTARTDEPPPPFELTPRMILGLEGVIFGVILVVGSRVLRRRNARAALGAVGGGLLAILAGGYVTAMAFQAEASSPDRIRNPIPVDDDALARGRIIYQQNCLACHGVAGRGDGPLGRSLNPRPADLRLHVTQHPEGVLYDYVTNGVPGSAMPSFKDVIPSDDRWRVIAFIKGFAEDGPAPAQTAVAGLRTTAGSGAAAASGTSATPVPAGSPAAGSADPSQRALAHPLASDRDATAAQADIGDRQATVRIAPARYVRGQPSAVDVSLGQGGDAGSPPVRYSFTMAGHQMPPDEGTAQPLGDGRYRIPPAERFDMGGDWRLDLDVGGRTATYWLSVGPGGDQVTFVEP